MKRVITGTFLAAAFAVGLSAQSATPPQSTTPPQSPAPQAQAPMQDLKDAAKTVAVTGCLKAGETADSFVLSDLKWKDRSAGAVGTSGTAAAPPAAIASATSLKLIPGSAKLTDHVGHTVEITGKVSEKAAASPSTPPADPASTRSSASAGPSLEVSNVKMVSATCSAK
jgi:hypothetical protein